MSNITVWFKGLRARLMLMISIPIAFLIAIVIFGNISIKKLHEYTTDAHENMIPLVMKFGEISGSVQAVFRYTAQASFESDHKKAKELWGYATEAHGMILKRGKDALEMSMSDGMRKELTGIMEIANNLSAALEKGGGLVGTGDEDNEKELNRIVFYKIPEIAFEMDGHVDMFKKETKNHVDSDVSDADDAATNIFRLFLIMGVFGTVLGLLISVFISARLAKTLTKMIEEVRFSSGEMAGASTQLSQVSTEMSASSVEVASSLEETVASLEEITSMISMNSQNGEQAANLSVQSTASAESGEGQVKHLITAMGDIATSSKKIEEIINVIDDIAFQTNLLALNAAVEAARAGEQGKGFAVVAEAVRSLAQRSSVAAKDISGLIRDSVDKVDNGAKLAEKSGAVLKEIVDSIRKVAELNKEISTASAEQAKGIAGISSAMNQIDQATQKNAATSEEMNATAETLTSHAGQLDTIVQNLTALVNGGAMVAVDSHEAEVNQNTEHQTAS